MSPLHALRPGTRALALLLPLLPACNWLLAADDPGASGASESDSESTSDSDSSSASEPPTSTDSATESTTVDPHPCDMDNVCDPGEEAGTCADCLNCGNGQVDDGEACDDGNADNTDDCVNCNLPACGDGFIQGTEVCDDGAANSDDWAKDEHCKADCRGFAPFCGDAVCQLPDESVNSCPEDGCKATCGNGVLEPGEVCDSGGVNTDKCDSDCSTPDCGDGIINDKVGEQCEDDNNVDTDACVACKTAACGDGFVQTDVEACDDGDPSSDDCSDKCELPRRVFVTSTLFKGDLAPAIGNNKGLDLADAHCLELAVNAKLGGFFRAWLSDETGSPSTRFDKNFTGAYKLVDGTSVVSKGWGELSSGTLLHAIDLDDMGKSAAGDFVWSNTSFNGTPLGVESCTNWSSTKNTSHVGDSAATDPTWSDTMSLSCNVALRLYCFEDIP